MNYTKMKIVYTSAVLLFGLNVWLNAQLNIEYDATGYAGTGTPPEFLTPTAVPAFVSATGVSRGAGLNAGVLTNGFSASHWTNPSADHDGLEANRANAILQNDYFQLSISITGPVASFTSLDARVRRSGATSPNTAEWQYSLDGFTTAGITLHQYDVAIPTGGDGTDMPNIDLSAISALQDLDTGSEVSFRLYTWGSTSSTSTFAFARSAMLASAGGAAMGPVISIGVIPEPGVTALMTGGLIMLLVIFRRQRIQSRN